MVNEEIYKAHERIGFPEISEKDQADILIWGDVGIINKLTPYCNAEFIPKEIAKKYVKLNKQTFKEYFINSGFIESLNETHLQYPSLDGKWIEKADGERYLMKVQERGGLVHIEYFENYDAMINYFADWIYRKYEF